MKPMFGRLRPAQAVLILSAVLFIAVVLLQGGNMLKVWAMPAQPAPLILSPDAPETADTCIIAYIFAEPAAFRVQCTQPVPATVIFSFAIPIESISSQGANRMAALITTAYALGKPVTIYFTDNIANNPIGCVTSTCRRLDYLYIQP
jgi:hypothetical protein